MTLVTRRVIPSIARIAPNKPLIIPVLNNPRKIMAINVRTARSSVPIFLGMRNYLKQ